MLRWFGRYKMYGVGFLIGITGAVSHFYGSAHPKISIITSLYKGEAFIAQFMEDIVQQTVFDQCELIIIDANSPEHEQEVIQLYTQKHSNIRYIRLEHDPGIYGVWNMGIELARGEYLTNANVDDRLAHNCYQEHMSMLDKYPEVELVYSDYLLTYQPNELVSQTTGHERYIMPEFSQQNMRICLPNDHPMWRKSMHEKYGVFDVSFKSAGDWEMWLRAVAHGAEFKKVDKTVGLHYQNPKGMSTDPSHQFVLDEFRQLVGQYGWLWGQSNRVTV